MSTTNFGVNPLPVTGTQTRPYTAPVIPTPVPSAGGAAGYTNILNPQGSTMNRSGSVNPVLEAAAGPKYNIEWVDSIDQVLNHPTSPNEEMYFQDKNEPVIYRRETDGNGNIKNPIHVLRYTVEEMPFGPEAQFVTKDEHQKLYSLVESLAGTVNGMNDKLEQLLNG